MSEHRKIAFLDRDGVINLNTGYLYRKEEFHFTPGCLKALQDLRAQGFDLVIITNQSGIARGYYTEADFLALNRWMLACLAAEGIDILRVLYCPHLPAGEVSEYAIECQCRKPKPGMILELTESEKVDMDNSLLVGDNLSDIQAGAAAGLRRLFLVDPHNDISRSHPGSFIPVSGLPEVVNYLTNHTALN